MRHGARTAVLRDIVLLAVVLAAAFVLPLLLARMESDLGHVESAGLRGDRR